MATVLIELLQLRVSNFGFIFCLFVSIFTFKTKFDICLYNVKIFSGETSRFLEKKHLILEDFFNFCMRVCNPESYISNIP